MKLCLYRGKLDYTLVLDTKSRNLKPFLATTFDFKTFSSRLYHAFSAWLFLSGLQSIILFWFNQLLLVVFSYLFISAAVGLREMQGENKTPMMPSQVFPKMNESDKKFKEESNVSVVP